MNQQLFETNIYDQSNHYENNKQFPLWMDAPCAYHKTALFTVSKDEWDTKEGTGKPMKNALYTYSSMAKGTSWAEVTLSNEKIKPVALAIQVMLVWKHQVGSY